MNRNIFGSHGEFTIDEKGIPTGEIPEPYRNIRRVDLPENAEDMDPVDILCCGLEFTDAEGVVGYEPPDPEYLCWLKKMAELNRVVSVQKAQ